MELTLAQKPALATLISPATVLNTVPVEEFHVTADAYRDDKMEEATAGTALGLDCVHAAGLILGRDCLEGRGKGFITPSSTPTLAADTRGGCPMGNLKPFHQNYICPKHVRMESLATMTQLCRPWFQDLSSCS